jgi:hypothetical protein
VTDDLLLPEGTRLLHIGPQKTGTTAIQVAMAEARDAMASYGAYYPAGDHRRRKAGWALGLPGGPRDTPIQHWTDLVAEVDAAPALRVCVSDENFARAEPQVVARIVSELGGSRPHVVAVARRLDRFLPSQWQERVKAGIGDTFEEWLQTVLGDEPARSWERWNVWMGHDVEALVHRWTDQVGPDNFTLVITDESDRRQLADTFTGLLGLPAETLQTRADRSNQGFGLAEVELLRRLRVVFDQNGWGDDEFHRLVRRGVRRRIGARSGPVPGPKHAPLPVWALDRLRELSERRVGAISTLGIRVVGQPEWLRLPDDLTVEPVDLDALSVPVDLAVEAIGEVIARQHGAGERALSENPDAMGGRELARRLVGRIARRLRVGRT